MSGTINTRKEMKTLLKITTAEDLTYSDVEFDQSEESMGILLMSFGKVMRNNLNFRALICAAFELICKEHPDAFEHLKECLAKKENTQATIHVTPNPTKS
jgi:hypothetical protein